MSVLRVIREHLDGDDTAGALRPIDGWPVPPALDLERIRLDGGLHPELEFILGVANGECVTITAATVTTAAGRRRVGYRAEVPAIMVECPSGPGLTEFQRWYTGRYGQFYASGEMAAAAFIAAYREWLRAHPKPKPATLAHV
jgi:hypothetical protein